MKRQTTLAMFGILFAAAMALGVLTVSGFSQPLFVASTNTQAANQLDMLGHITLTATDREGNIISYIQTDNIIVNRGENCVAESLFNVNTTGTDNCTGNGVHTGGNGVADGGFTYIAIGNGTTLANATDQTLVNENNRTQDTSPAVTSSSGTGASSTAVVTLTSVFSSGGSFTITESGIFDEAGTDAGNMLARKTFGGIPLNTGDKLTVEWEIKVGGS